MFDIMFHKKQLEAGNKKHAAGSLPPVTLKNATFISL